VSGSVLRIVAESEQVVQAGTPLIEIGDPADLEIAVDFLSRDAVRIPPAAPARIESWGGETVLNARVRRVEPTAFTKVSALGIEEQRVRTILDFTDPPVQWRRLGHGYRVVARVEISRQDDVPLVPLGALFRSGERWAVFVVQDGRAQLRPIEIAQRNQRFARVVEGLREGDRVVLHPSDRIRDGTAVTERQ
jgi:HlyD family secretion protein